MLTVSEANDDVTSALNAGAQGYVLKGVGSKMLAEILQGVARGETYVSPVLAARMLANLRDMNARASPANPLSLLTQRERQILEFVAQRAQQQGGRHSPRSPGEDGQASHDAHHGEAGRAQPHRGRDAAARRRRLRTS